MIRQLDKWFQQFLLSEYFYHKHRSVLNPPLCNRPAMWPRVSGVVADSPLYKERVSIKIASLIYEIFNINFITSFYVNK